MKGMTTCKVCGRDFPLISEEHYTARNPDKEGGQIGLVIAGKEEPAMFDAFDCPHCGCQNILQERKRIACRPHDFDICDECDHVGETETPEHDGCVGCKYIDEFTDDYPCNECKENYKDMYEKDEEEKDE